MTALADLLGPPPPGLTNPDPEHAGHHPQTRQCRQPDPERVFLCTRVAGHTQTWHVAWDQWTGRTLKTWETT